MLCCAYFPLTTTIPRDIAQIMQIILKSVTVGLHTHCTAIQESSLYYNPPIPLLNPMMRTNDDPSKSIAVCLRYYSQKQNHCLSPSLLSNRERMNINILANYTCYLTLPFHLPCTPSSLTKRLKRNLKYTSLFENSYISYIYINGCNRFFSITLLRL